MRARERGFDNGAGCHHYPAAGSGCRPPPPSHQGTLQQASAVGNLQGIGSRNVTASAQSATSHESVLLPAWPLCAAPTHTCVGGGIWAHGGSPWPTAISLYGAHKESTVHASGLGCAKLCSPLTVELHSHTGGHVSNTKAQCMSLGLANKLVTQYVSKTLREIK